MTVYERILGYVTQTMQAPPSGTVTKYPWMASAGFRSIDALGGARVDLEMAVGQSRVFEIDLEDSEADPLELGGAVPSSYNEEISVRVRYESHGPSRKQESLTSIKGDQFALCDALHRAQWSKVYGLASLIARPGNILSFTLSDDAGNEYEGYTSEIALSVSFDA